MMAELYCFNPKSSPDVMAEVYYFNPKSSPDMMAEVYCFNLKCTVMICWLKCTVST